MIQSKHYRTDIDILKGFSIIAVVLYHLSVFPTGYLGVDVFFVISGYLIASSLKRDLSVENKFKGYWFFLNKRLKRLFPLIVLATTSCFLFGFCIGMLPDDFENLCETVVASNLMSNNILSSKTIRDYWAVRTSYQPLMHFWYIGILFEYYLILPLIYLLSGIVNQEKRDKIFFCVLLGLALLSLVVFLSPKMNDAERFYLLPSRFFELAFGTLFSFKINGKQFNSTPISVLRIIAILVLTFAFCIGLKMLDLEQINKVIPIGATVTDDSYDLTLPRSVLLLLTVASTLVLVGFEKSSVSYYSMGPLRIFALVGKMSLSIFVWHQIFIAFYKYSISDVVSLPYIIQFSLFVVVISYLSYYFIEQKDFKWKAPLSYVLGGVVSVLAIIVYLNAGVTRDVPELDVYKKDAHLGMHEEYTGSAWSHNNGFEDNGKYNVLTQGNSFSRDFVNIIIESPYRDSVNFKMISKWNEVSEKDIRACDYIFAFSDKSDVPSFVWENIDSSRVYGIGTKNFGSSNGIIYSRRDQPDYFSSSIEPYREYIELNNKWKKSWGGQYFDLLSLSMLENGRIRIFTPDNKYMSQDCKHLTRSGAKYYAERIDFSKVFTGIRRHKQ